MNAPETRERNYLLVSPFRDEASHLEKVVRHVTSQTVKPVRWILIDDQSRDRSPEICENAAKLHPWIRVVRFKGSTAKRQLGIHVYQVLKSGYEYGSELCREEGIDYRYVAFLDGDMFPAYDYFERLIDQLEKNPRLGIISGGVYLVDTDGRITRERCPEQWPWGGARILTRECLEKIGGVITVNSGDAVASIRAMKFGYEIRQFKEIRVIQARATSSASGLVAGYFQKGIDDYFLGYSVPYVVAKGAYRCTELSFRPALAYLAGYLSSWIRLKPRIDDPVVREFCRWRLLRRIVSQEFPGQRGVWPKKMKAEKGQTW